MHPGSVWPKPQIGKCDEEQRPTRPKNRDFKPGDSKNNGVPGTMRFIWRSKHSQPGPIRTQQSSRSGEIAYLIRRNLPCILGFPDFKCDRTCRDSGICGCLKLEAGSWRFISEPSAVAAGAWFLVRLKLENVSNSGRKYRNCSKLLFRVEPGKQQNARQNRAS